MYVTMKVGKKKRRRRPDAPPEEEMAYSAEMAREAGTAKRSMKHITTQPLWVQQSFATRNKSLDELFPKK